MPFLTPLPPHLLLLPLRARGKNCRPLCLCGQRGARPSLQQGERGRGRKPFLTSWETLRQVSFISEAQFRFSRKWEQKAFLRQQRLGNWRTKGAPDMTPVHGTSTPVLFDSAVLPAFPPASAVPPPSSCRPLLPCQCYHSSSNHINYIPLPPSKPSPESSSPQTLPNFLPCLWLVTWVTGRLTSTLVIGGGGRLPGFFLMPQ